MLPLDLLVRGLVFLGSGQESGLKHRMRRRRAKSDTTQDSLRDVKGSSTMSIPKYLSAAQTANWFIDHAAATRTESLNLHRLLALVYVAHGWRLALKQTPLIDEAPQAWSYGPVVPSLYHEFKNCGNKPIRRRSGHLDLTTQVYTEPTFDPADTDLQTLLKTVWNAHAGIPGNALYKSLSRPGTPWYAAFHQSGALPDKDIPDQSIEDWYYKRIHAYINAASSTNTKDQRETAAPR